MYTKLWMTTNPKTVTPEQPVADGVSILQDGHFRHLLVVDQEGGLLGVVSRHDLADAMPSIFDGSSGGDRGALSESSKIGDIMTANPIWVDSLTPIETIAAKMRKHKIGCLPVLEGSRLVGIITESDIFAAFSDILGGDREGVRLELLIGKEPRALYDVLDIFKRYDIFIQAVTVFRDFSPRQCLVTARLDGRELQLMLESLRKEGVQISRILGDESGEGDSAA